MHTFVWRWIRRKIVETRCRSFWRWLPMFWYMPAVIFCRRHRIFNNSLSFVQLFFQQSLILLNFFKELFSSRLLGGESQVIRFEFGNKFIIVIEFSLHISKIFGFFLILLSSNINFVSCNKKKCKSLIKYTLLNFDEDKWHTKMFDCFFQLRNEQGLFWQTTLAMPDFLLQPWAHTSYVF